MKWIIQFFREAIHQLVGGPCCRFEPTCSHYAREAFSRKTFFVACYLVGKRILRCHPWGSYGWDPVSSPHSALPSGGPEFGGQNG